MGLLKNILITGGAGFIGSYLSLALLKCGYHVTVLDNLSPQVHGPNPDITSPLYQLIKGKVHFINGSVTSKADWLEALPEQDCIVHLAAETGTGQSMHEIKRYTDVNIGGTALMLELLLSGKYSIRKIVLASSRAVYGEGAYFCDTCGVVYPSFRKDKNMRAGDYECKCPCCGKTVRVIPISENCLLHPVSIYGITKQTQEQLVTVNCLAMGIPSVIFRYQNVYGPGQSLLNPYTGILSFFSNQIKNDKIINIYEDGAVSRDFIYIDDVVEATILGIEKKDANEHIFNIGTGVSHDILSVARALIDKYGIDIPIKISGDYRLGDIRYSHTDITLAREMLAFEPKVTLDMGLKRWMEWIKVGSLNNY